MNARPLLVAVCLLAAAPAAAGPPATMPFQGILTDAAGAPIAAGTPVTFSLRDAYGAPLWSAIYVVTPVDGVVSLLLGANDGGGQAALPPGIFTTGAVRELALSVGGEELAAIPLGSTAYALHAATADVALNAGGLGPGSVDSVALADGAVTSAKLADAAVTAAKLADAAVGAAKLADGAVGAAKLAGGAVTAAKLADGAVGAAAIADGAVGTAELADGSVSAADIGPAILSSLDGVSNDGGNIDLVAGANVTISSDDAANTITIGATGGGGGIAGSGAANYLPRFTGAAAIGNSALYQSGSSLGLGTTAPDRLFVASAAAGDAILGEVTATGQTDYIGVEGIAVPSEAYGVGGQFLGGYLGIWARSEGTSAGDYYGVYGHATSGTGGYAYGTTGDAQGSEINVGVLGYAAGGTANYAGYFLGDIQVDGLVYSGGLAMRVDHPLDPAGRALSQAAVLSDGLKCVYDGSVRLDAEGRAWVELPPYVAALAGEFRYQLTCVGGYAPVYVAAELAGGRFAIAGGTPGLKVCWQLTGLRQDAWARRHPLAVEADKPAAERGRYLHPAAAGQPAARGLLPPPALRLRGR
ncbi:hypothetical protein FJ251_03375 [bacterium]|nr:hypothetical protein [bacterium]